MQETVAGRQIQQLALPQRQLAGRAFINRIDFDIEPGERRGFLQPFNSWRSIGSSVGRLCHRDERHRTNLLHPGSVQVDGHDELLIIKLTLGGCNGLGEARRRCLCRKGGFEYHHFLQIQAFAYCRRLIGQQLGKLLRLQPDACECVPLGHDKQGIQACLLQRRSKQQCSVQTGRHAVFQNHTWRPDLLALLLKTGRGQCIAQLKAAHSGPNGRGKLPGSRARLAFIAVNAIFLARAPQNL